MSGQGTMLNRALLEAAFIAFSTVFDMKLKNTPTIYQDIATIVPGVSERIEFKWLGSIPTMKRWIGDRTIQKLRGESQALTTEWWANGIEVHQDDFIVQSKLGMLMVRIRGLAEAAGRRIDDQVAQYYLNAFTAALGTSYDGQFLVDIDHTAGTGAGVRAGEAQSNLIAGGLSSATFNAGIERSMEFTDDEGEPVMTDPSVLMVGPKNQLVARQLLKATQNAAGATNVDAGMVKPLIAPRFGTSTAWFLLTSAEIKAVMVGMEVDPQFAQQASLDSPEVFRRNTYLYGSHTKFGLCYGPWQSVLGSQG